MNIRETPNFVVSYEVRSPRSGRGDATGGVRNMSLVDWYCEGLEATARVFAGTLGWRWPTTKKTPVYVTNLMQQFALIGDNIPFTSVAKGIPFIGLPCRINEPTVEAARLKAMADAAHQAVHVLNATYRPFMNVHSAPWRWFNEGTAVFGERFALSCNPDNLRFAMDWCDRPEDSLDSNAAWYQSGLFLHYVVQRFGVNFLARIWKESTLAENPVETMQRLLQSVGMNFAAADPTVSDVFGEGYAVDAYCDWGNGAASFAGDAFQRYGPRAVTESFELRIGDSVMLQNDHDSLDHLAIRYYRFFIDQKVTSLQVSLTSAPDDGENRLKATLVTVNDDWTRGGTAQLVPATADARAGSPMKLEVTLSIDQPARVDHVVLVVANCGVRASTGGNRTPHDDHQDFAVKAKALGS